MGSGPVSIEYLASGANRQTAVADWSQCGILAFGADINIALWRPLSESPKGVTKLLNGHKSTVKALTFLPEGDQDENSFLVSGSDGKTVIIWKAPRNSDEFKPIHTSTEHTAAINCIAALRIKGAQKWVIATGSADASIKIWNFENDQLTLRQSVKTTPKYFPMCLSLSYAGDEDDVLVLASAGTRDIVQIFTAETKSENAQFNVQATLTGHEGWIRSLSFAKETCAPGSDLLLASASQDKYVRIWRFHQGRELPAAAASGSDPSSDAYLPGKSPSNKAHRLKSAGKDFSVTFEALLLGHEDWIYSARWQRQDDDKLQLLSTSADNSLAIWEADSSSGIWVSMARLGEISREKGATTATGSTGGFWTGLWSPDGKSVACLGRTGSWRRWEYVTAEDFWKPCVAISGHTRAVTGITWAKNGNETWHEMSRPQIHGYDLNCIDSVGASQFVSGADEKLMRVFSEPKAVASMLNRLAGIGGGMDVQNMPDAANMPVLGLSNKAIDAVEDDQEIQPIDDRDREAMDPASIVKKSHLEIDHPPFEETLSRHTLWPETEKLYGHGYEISCLAASHDGTLVASACKASSTNHAVIRLFETNRWTELRPPLTAHSLTATRLRFSSDDQFLLSVGRDRQWAVFERAPEDEAAYKLLQINPKGHTRMVLDAAWAPASSTAPVFATAGRDKQVRIWAAKPNEDGKLQFSQTASIPTASPVTSVDFVPQVIDGRFVLAVGTELGRLSLCLIKEDGTDVTEKPAYEDYCLPKAVHQLAWRPIVRGGAERPFELAVAGEDSSLRVYAFSQAYLQVNADQ
ncbi:elongator complex 2 [Fusarium coicis]|nr:elongator complex 2 [Fusarium coicis]